MKKQLLLIPMLFLSIAVSAQNQKIRLQSQAPMKVSEIFNLIESQTSMTVAYNDKNVDVDRTVSVDASGMTLDQLLDHILSGTGTTVKYHGKIVAIVEEGNEHTYSGVVLDQQGPVVGAVLTVSGNQNAAVTGLDGEFSIVAQEGSVLKVSIL